MAKTTDDLKFPVLLVGKFGLLKFRKNRDELVERVDRLRRLNEVTWFHVIDNELDRYRVLKSSAVRGHGFFSGYSFDGPFLLKRNVIFRGDVKFVTKMDLRTTAELVADFMRGAQGVRNNDVSRFWAEFDRFSLTALPNLSPLWEFYSSFRWGDDLEEET